MQYDGARITKFDVLPAITTIAAHKQTDFIYNQWTITILSFV